MAGFAKDNNLRIVVCVILPLYSTLQLQHHGACGVYYLNVVLSRQLVCFGRLAVCPEQHLHIVQLPHVVMIDCDKAHCAQPFTLHAVVHDVS